MRARRINMIVGCKLDRLGGAAEEVRFGGTPARDADRADDRAMTVGADA